MKLRLVKGVLWLACGAHLLLGVAGAASPALGVDAARLFYGATVEATPANLHLLRIIAAYMITMGVVAAVAARDPARHRLLIAAIALLLFLRVGQRLMHAGEIQQTFGVSDLRLWIQSGWFALLGAVLLLGMPKRESAT